MFGSVCSILRAASPNSQALLRSHAGPKAGAWLSAYPDGADIPAVCNADPSKSSWTDKRRYKTSLSEADGEASPAAIHRPKYGSATPRVRLPRWAFTVVCNERCVRRHTSTGRAFRRTSTREPEQSMQNRVFAAVCLARKEPPRRLSSLSLFTVVVLIVTIATSWDVGEAKRSCRYRCPLGRRHGTRPQCTRL